MLRLADKVQDVRSCTDCGGSGRMIVRDESPNAPWPTKAVPCPACEAGQTEAAYRRMIASLKGCANCDDAGFLIGRDDTREACSCAAGQAYAERQYSLVRGAGVPEKYKKFTLQSFDRVVTSQDAWQGKYLAYALAAELVKHRSKLTLEQAVFEQYGQTKKFDFDDTRCGAVFIGPVGTGKTGLMAGMYHALEAKRVAALYIRMPQLLENIQATYKPDYVGPSRAQQIATAQRVPWLMLDEMTLEKYTDDKREIIEAIVRERHSRDLPIVVTSNLDENDFYQCWGDRISDVLFEMAHVVIVGGAKLRRTSRAQSY